jgi:hypothetical protein
MSQVLTERTHRQRRTVFLELARSLCPGACFIVMTPNLGSYGVLGNAIPTKVAPEKPCLGIVHAKDARADGDIFPVRYKVSIQIPSGHLLNASGLQVHRQSICGSSGPIGKTSLI